MQPETQSANPVQPPEPRPSGLAAVLRWALPLLAVVLLAALGVSQLGRSWREQPAAGIVSAPTDPALRTTLKDLRARIDALRSLAREHEQAEPQAPAAGDRKGAPTPKSVFDTADAEALHRKLDDIERTLSAPDTSIRLAAVGREIADREQAVADLKRSVEHKKQADEAAQAEITALKNTIARQQAEIDGLRQKVADLQAPGDKDTAATIRTLEDRVRTLEASEAEAKREADRWKTAANLLHEIVSPRRTIWPQFTQAEQNLLKDRFRAAEVTWGGDPRRAGFCLVNSSTIGQYTAVRDAALQRLGINAAHFEPLAKLFGASGQDYLNNFTAYRLDFLIAFDVWEEHHKKK